jgi:hypothetical protein
MTIASEITRLQWAKSDIKTSIENKGVAVPSNTKLDDYSDYIDQIVQGGTWMSGIQLRTVEINTSQGSLQSGGFVSRLQDDKAYWCALFAQNRTSNYVYYDLYTFSKTTANTDVNYTFNEWAYFGTAHYWTQIKNSSFWTNGTRCKAYFFIITDYSTNWVKLFEAAWDYTTTNSATVTQIASGTSTNLSDYNVDLDGYTQRTTNDWVGDVAPVHSSDHNYIYLTLK